MQILRFGYVLFQMPEFSYRSPGISEDMFKLTLKVIRNLDKESNKSASILIFLPGIYEIGRLHTILQNFSET